MTDGKAFVAPDPLLSKTWYISWIRNHFVLSW